MKVISNGLLIDGTGREPVRNAGARASRHRWGLAVPLHEDVVGQGRVSRQDRYPALTLEVGGYRLS